MVIGAFVLNRRTSSGLAASLAFIWLGLRLVADDQIVKKDGTAATGHIVSVSDGQVFLETHTSTGGIAKLPYFMADIKSVTMETPADVVKVQAPGTEPGLVISTLEPEVKKFEGLTAPWVVNAMAQLGDAYTQVGQLDKALAVYNEISQFYPGSPYENVATASRAELSLNAGKIDEALGMVQPIVDAANKNIAPSPKDGETYAKAFLVYGRAKEAQKQPQAALEAYLTVKTMFYQNPTLVAEAEHFAKDLRDKNPGFGID